MRDIKFRVWDTRLKEMHKVNNILFSESAFTPERVTAHFKNGQYNISGKIDGGREDAFKLMQYTGIKDKNGVEVYEGDIVKFRFTRLYNKVRKPGDKARPRWFKSAVEWDDGAFLISEIQHNDSPLVQCLADDETKLEVVGNIYESLELPEARP